MAEIQSQKRPRDETEISSAPLEDLKRQKTSYSHVLLTVEEEEEPAEDFWELLTSVEQELSVGGGESTPVGSGEWSAESVMRHLVEASDEELGIPEAKSGLGLGTLWELEDEAANYYTLLQSELFL